MKQLGPVVSSGFRNAYHSIIGTPTLERLVNLDWLVQSKLTNLFRQHPSLCDLASRLFYGSDLHSVRPADYWHTDLARTIFRCLAVHFRAFTPIEQLIAADCREYFINHKGLAQRADTIGNRNSYTNPNGLKLIGQMIEELIENGIDPKDIAIITMYREDAPSYHEGLPGSHP